MVPAEVSINEKHQIVLSQPLTPGTPAMLQCSRRAAVSAAAAAAAAQGDGGNGAAGGAAAAAASSGFYPCSQCEYVAANQVEDA